MPKEKGKSPNLPHKPKEHMQKAYSKHENGSSNSLVDDGSRSTPKYDWEDATCPVCMETPHNSVLLYCSSYHKGCRSYICDTGYRHSNCLDQYCKAHIGSYKVYVDGHERAEDNSNMASPSFSWGDNNNEDPNEVEKSVELSSGLSTICDRNAQNLLGLRCPLCRGQVQGWEVVKEARHYLDAKTRVCASESCSFMGSYEELRAHARREHPFARPSEKDPVRVRQWARLQWQQDIGDVWSVISSAMSRSTSASVIDGNDHDNNEEDYMNVIRSDISHDGEDHHLTVSSLFHVFGAPYSRPSLSSRGARRRFRGSTHARQGLWGEILHRSHENDIRDAQVSVTSSQQWHRHSFQSPPG